MLSVLQREFLISVLKVTARTKAPPNKPPKKQLPLINAPKDLNKVIAKPPKEVFSPNNMKKLVNSTFTGEDTPELNKAMEDFMDAKDQEQIESSLKELSKIRGISEEEMQVQYERFKMLQERQLEIAKKNGKDPPAPVNKMLHGDFAGSTACMRYGQIVGEVLGIDPIFASMLNPTGGLVGDGNMSFNPDDDSPLGYHAIVHDAAGYLNNLQDMGPGYDYLDKEERDTTNPLTGQQSGVRYWYEELDPGISTNIKLLIVDEIYEAYDDLTELKEDITETKNKVVNVLKNTAKNLKSGVKDGIKFTQETLEQSAKFFTGLI